MSKDYEQYRKRDDQNLLREQKRAEKLKKRVKALLLSNTAVKLSILH